MYYLLPYTAIYHHLPVLLISSISTAQFPGHFQTIWYIGLFFPFVSRILYFCRKIFYEKTISKPTAVYV
jgi:hypothetical protein